MSVESGRPSWQLLVDAIERETDERRRHNLEIVATHVVHEVAGDIPGVLATLCAEPKYRFWGPTSTRPADGTEAVRAHYEALVETGRNRLEFHISRVIADERHVVTEGEFRFAYSASMVRELPNAPAGPIDDDAWYLVAIHCIVVWPIDEAGLIEGEDIFAGEPPRVVRRLAPGEALNLGPQTRAA